MKEFSSGQKRVAAFFDLDGTLTAGHSLEWNYFLALRERKKIPAINYLRWLREALRLAPRGISQMRHANKMYLRGVPCDCQLPAPKFLRQALDQVAWHARQGHLVVLVSGTLEPLAKRAADFMEADLLRRGIDSTVRVFATQLQEHGAKWTGRIISEARIGKAKAESLHLFAAELNLNLARCYAYGDSIHDIPMLALVGRPATVNASPDLRDVARREGWPEISWQRETPGARRTGEIIPAKQTSGSPAAERWA
jgi:HAD superfamily hydrolase (TIGR01490 family)